MYTKQHLDGNPQSNFKIRSYELVIPPSVKEYVENTKVSSIKTKNAIYLNNGNEKNIIRTATITVNNNGIYFKNFLDFNNIDKSDYSKLTFLGKKNLNEIQNNENLDTALKQATNSEIEFVN